MVSTLKMVGTLYKFCLFATAIVSLVSTLCTEEEMTKENTNKLAIANNELALKIHRQLSSEMKENFFFSPLSLSTVFGMLYYGTKGKTAEELRNVLGYEKADLPEELVHRAFQEYLSKVLKNQDPSVYVLNSANSILMDKNLNLELSYQREISDLYLASVDDVDFATEGQQVVKTVNSWVKNKTNGMIDKVLDELDPSTVLVLLNAVYFKGTWKIQFKSEDTKPQMFFNNGLTSAAKIVPTMRLTERFPYTVIYDLHAIDLPYKGGNMSMMILLPTKRDGLEALEKSLSLERITEIRNELQQKTTKVRLNLPRFSVRYSGEMSRTFRSLGAESIFAPGADFSGMTCSRKVFVSQVIHEAVVEVNEQGSEAATSTAILVERSMRADFEYFIADHPFLFIIIDKRNDMILFMGRVTNL